MSAIDFDLEPESAILDLRIVSVHASGRVLRWHVVVSKRLTVGELLRTIVVRTQVTDAKLQVGSTLLVELMHGKLHRTFENSMKVDRFRREDFLVVYEVPELVGDAKGTGKFLTVACHARFARDPAASHFFEDEEVYRDLAGLPLLLRVREGISERCLYDLVRAGFYGLGHGGALPASGKVAADGSPAPFDLFLCEQSRTLSTGGVRLNPDSPQLVRSTCTEGARNRKAVLLAAEWLDGQEISPWALQDAGSLGPLSDLPECYLEAIVGVDVADLCLQTQQLRTERKELLAEIDDLRKCLGRAASATNRGGTEEPSLGILSSVSTTRPQQQQQQMLSGHHDAFVSDREIRRGGRQAAGLPLSARKAHLGSPVLTDDAASAAGLESSVETDRLRLALMR